MKVDHHDRVAAAKLAIATGRSMMAYGPRPQPFLIGRTVYEIIRDEPGVQEAIERGDIRVLVPVT